MNNTEFMKVVLEGMRKRWRFSLPLTLVTVLGVLVGGFDFGRWGKEATQELEALDGSLWQYWTEQEPPESCAVAAVVDGDTLECQDGTRVRLLLIDTPEMEQAPFGAQATEALLRLVQVGDTVRMETDLDTYDQYGRLLAYLYTPEGVHVNAELVRRGYAVVLYYAPNDQYLEEFRRLDAEARAAERGLWATGGFECRPRAYRRGRC